ncbi:MAG TPA: FtsX-like permease family protein, partial [Vicinamibacterales bacterium]|nr:FtsX-like permease family protein [Vicinamibacterales bacterium]
VTPGHFSTFDIPLVRGRGFTDADRADAPGVVLVSVEAARRYWPDGDAVGRRIRLVGAEAPLEVVGVVGDVFNRPELGEAVDPQLYLPFAQHPRRALAFAVRAAADPETLLEPIRAAVHAEDPDQAVYNLRTMAQTFHEQLATDRLIFGMFASFALIALALASSGLYGVIAYSVAQRTQEFGVRLALGARSGDVVRSVVLHGLTLAVIGTLAGAGGGFALAQVVASMLQGVGPADPVTYAGVVLTLFVVATMASYVPARRAMGLDPIRALRR